MPVITPDRRPGRRDPAAEPLPAGVCTARIEVSEVPARHLPTRPFDADALPKHDLVPWPEMRAGFAAVRAGFQAEVAGLRAEMHQGRADMKLWVNSWPPERSSPSSALSRHCCG